MQCRHRAQHPGAFENILPLCFEPTSDLQLLINSVMRPSNGLGLYEDPRCVLAMRVMRVHLMPAFCPQINRALRCQFLVLRNAQGSMLTGNTAVDSGGAVTCLSCGELSTQMTTFSNNTAAGGYGGGLQCVLTASNERDSCPASHAMHAVMTLPAAETGSRVAPVIVWAHEPA